MTLEEVRKKYPQYADLTDEQLAKGLHEKFYSDMPFEEFSNKIGYKSETQKPLNVYEEIKNLPEIQGMTLEKAQQRREGGGLAPMGKNILETLGNIAIGIPTWGAGMAGKYGGQIYEGLMKEGAPTLEQLISGEVPPDIEREERIFKAGKNLEELIGSIGSAGMDPATQKLTEKAMMPIEYFHKGVERVTRPLPEAARDIANDVLMLTALAAIPKMAKAVAKKAPVRIAKSPEKMAELPESKYIKGKFKERFIEEPAEPIRPKEKPPERPVMESEGVKKGDWVTDDLVSGIVVGEGTVGKNIPAWKIKTGPNKTDLIIKDQVTQSIPSGKGTTLYSGLPLPEFVKLGNLWTKKIGEPIWDKGVMQKIPKVLEKIPGGKAINRALIREYRGNLPNTEKYIASIDKRILNESIGREYGIDLGRRLTAFDETTQIKMGEAIRGELDFESLSPVAKKHVVESEYAMISLGKQLVDVGLLSEEAFFKHIGRYMPRLYTKHEFKSLLTKWNVTKPNRLDLSRVKRRKDIPKEIREQMGEILTPGYPIAKGIIQMTHDIELARFFNGIAKNPDWAIPKGSKTAIPEGWKKIEGEKLGSLDKAHVHPEIFKDLQEAIRVIETPERVWRKSLGYWKFGKVILSPKTHSRNMMSNSILAHLGGMPMYEQPIFLVKAIKEMRAKGNVWKEAKDFGLLSDTFTNAELRTLFDAVNSDVTGIRAGSIPDSMGKLGTAIEAMKKTGRGFAKAYEFEEQWFKMAKMIHNIERRGMKPTAAAKDAEKWLFNYRKVTKFQEKYRSKWYGAPFCTFCVSEDTEILTHRGWLRYFEIQDSDETLAYDYRTKKLEWQKIESVHVFPHNGQLLHIDSRSLDILMTPNHRCVIEREDNQDKRQRSDYHREYYNAIVEARDLRKRDKIIVAGNYIAPSVKTVDDDLVRLIGWFVTEGYYHKPTNSVYIGQTKIDGQKDIENIRKRLGIEGYRVKETQYKNGNGIHKDYYIPAHIRDEIEKYIFNKELSVGFLRLLTKDQLKLLYDAMINGDGCRSGDHVAQFIQNPGKTLDSFQTLCVMLGFQPGITKKKSSDCFSICETTIKSRQIKRNMPMAVQYHGVVWCPKTKHSTWVARRNGKVFITGNTFKALPRITEAAIKTPWRFALPTAIVYAMQRAAFDLIGDTKEEFAAKKELRPDWMKDKSFIDKMIPRFARFSFVDEYGREHYWNLTYILPWGDISEGGEFMGIPGSIRPMSQPFVNELAQQIGNYDFFWKDEIVPEKELAGKTKMQKFITEAKLRGAHLGRTMAPTPVIDILKGKAALSGQPDYKGRERAKGVVAADVFAGVKLYPVDYSEELVKKINKINPEKGYLAREIKGQIRTYSMKRAALAKKGKSTEFYDKLIESKIKQLKGLAAEVRDLGELKKKSGK